MEEENKIRVVRYNPLTLHKSYTNDAGVNDRASLIWSSRMANPRISVYTESAFDAEGKPKVKEPGKITSVVAPFNYITFGIFLSNINNILEAKNESKIQTDCYNTKYVDNKPTTEIAIQASVIVGRNKDGVIYIAVMKDGLKKVSFELLPDKYVKYYSSDGEVITDKKTLSNMFTKVYIDTINKLFSDDLNVIGKNISYTDPVNFSKNKNGTVVKASVPTTANSDIDDLF